MVIKAMTIDLCALLKTFLGSINESGPAYRAWFRKYKRMSFSSKFLSLLDDESELESYTLASLPICYFGFCNILQDWWDDTSMDPNQQNSKGNSLIVLAIMGRSIQAIKKLLTLGANPNMKLMDRIHGSALAAATGYDNASGEMVRLLIDAGADVNAELTTGIYGSALAAAANCGKRYIVRVLINAGADVNARPSTGLYGSALAAAAKNSKANIVQLLVKSGAEVNAQLAFS
jgi:hypothetical protein